MHRLKVFILSVFGVLAIVWAQTDLGDHRFFFDKRFNLVSAQALGVIYHSDPTVDPNFSSQRISTGYSIVVHQDPGQNPISVIQRFSMMPIGLQITKFEVLEVINVSENSIRLKRSFFDGSFWLIDINSKSKNDVFATIHEVKASGERNMFFLKPGQIKAW